MAGRDGGPRRHGEDNDHATVERDSHRGHASGDLGGLLQDLRPHAELAARRHALPPDLADDLVQEVLLRHHQGRVPGRVPELRKLLNSLARAESSKSRRQLRPGSPRRYEAPLLCPKICGLAVYHPDPMAFVSEVATAARQLALSRRVLKDERFRVFCLTWMERCSREQILNLLGLPRCQWARVRELQRRIVVTLEAALAGVLRDRLPSQVRASWDQAKDEAVVAIAVADVLKAIRHAVSSAP